MSNPASSLYNIRKFVSLPDLPPVGGHNEVVYVSSERDFYTYYNNDWNKLSGSGGSSTNYTERTFLLAIGNPAVVGTSLTNKVTMTRPGSFVKAFINAKIAPTGASLIIDIKKNGVSIWSVVPSRRIRLLTGALTGTQTLFDSTTFAEGDILTIDIVQIGSTIAGQDITVQLLTSIT